MGNENPKVLSQIEVSKYLIRHYWNIKRIPQIEFSFSKPELLKFISFPRELGKKKNTVFFIYLLSCYPYFLVS